VRRTFKRLEHLIRVLRSQCPPCSCIIFCPSEAPIRRILVEASLTLALHFTCQNAQTRFSQRLGLNAHVFSRGTQHRIACCFRVLFRRAAAGQQLLSTLPRVKPPPHPPRCLHASSSLLPLSFLSFLHRLLVFHINCFSQHVSLCELKQYR
jgi:hypothetical protein